MSWFSSKNSTQSTEASGQKSAAAVAPVLPFYNVMPKAKVRVEAVAEEVAQTPPKQAPTIAPIAAEKPVQAQKPVPVVASYTNTSALTAKNDQGKDLGTVTQTPRAVRMIAIVLTLALLILGVLFTYRIFGKNINIIDTVRQLLHKVPPIAHKDAKTIAAAVPEITQPDLPPVEYKTSPEWRMQYFKATDCEACADNADPDRDGLENTLEFQAKSDPTKADTDGDGLSDSDEVQVFGCLPTDVHSAGDQKYSDADDLKGGYDCAPGSAAVGDGKLSPARISDIMAKAGQYGFHGVTVTTLGDALRKYQTSTTEKSVSVPKLPDGVPATPEAMLDRDVQRLNTIKKIGVALLKYKTETGVYPSGSFEDMAQKVKPYNPVATNTQDPVNIEPYKYGYELDPEVGSFALTYYSETQKQLIRYTQDQAGLDVDTQGQQARDDQRIDDLEKIRSALLIYSAAAATANQSFVFPAVSQYQQKISPQYIPVVPKDPKTNKDYEYTVAKDFASFTLKAVLEKPTPATSGYVCTQDDCHNY